MQELVTSFRRSFLAGLVVVLPVAGSVFILLWLFTAFTDQLLPRNLRNENLTFVYRIVALLLFVLLVTPIGWITRLMAGKRLIALTESLIGRVPLLSKIYVFIKEVSDTMLSGKKTVFERVVMIEYPRPGLYTIGFVTNEAGGEAQAKTRERMINVFLPTTPNPTSGWLVLVPKDKVINMDMSVTDGMKLVISGGSVVPQWIPPAPSSTVPSVPVDPATP
jgi:uncharacterized membrane protein